MCYFFSDNYYFSFFFVNFAPKNKQIQNSRMKIEFRTAYIKDFAECWEVIDLARQQMISQGRHQWTNDYPSQQNITNDLNNGNAYVLTVDEKIAVYGALILNGEPQYEFLDGK